MYRGLASLLGMKVLQTGTSFEEEVSTLEEQWDCRILTNIIDCDPHNVYNKMPVEVVFEDISEEITLPKFRPALLEDREQPR